MFASIEEDFLFAYYKRNERLYEHYTASDTILLVGEGDFSFSLCLAEDFGFAGNMVATCFDSKVSLLSKYPDAKDNLIKLRKMRCTLKGKVDATEMDTNETLSARQYDRIIFNFSHAGFKGKENEDLQISLHKELVCGFFKSASQMLQPNGEIHVTHKTKFPYSEWELEELANEASLSLLEEVPFVKSDFPGYENKRGSSYRCNESFPIGECSIFKFVSV